MSSFSVISDSTKELRRQIVEALASTADTDFDLDGIENRIGLESPAGNLNDSAVASLYLYQVEVNQFLRNQGPLPDRDDASLLRRPPLPLQLHYLFTPVGEDESTNQLMLGRVLQHFYDRPTFSEVDGQPLGDSHGGASPELRVSTEPLSLEHLTQIWSSFTTALRTTVPLRVDVVAIDSASPPIRVQRARDVAILAGQMRRTP